jgi:hypothetical protein
MIRQWATRLTSAPFRARAPGPVYGQLYADDRHWRVRSCVCAFLSSFDCRHSLLGRPVPPRNSASLAVGLPAMVIPPDLTGFPCFALVSCDRCRAPPLPRDRGALMADCWTSATTAASQRRVLFSGIAFHLPKFSLTRLARVHHIRPSGLSLACDQWMEHRSLGFLPGFTPRRYQRRAPGAGTSVEHSLGANRRPFSTLHFGYLTQHSATSRRTQHREHPERAPPGEHRREHVQYQRPRLRQDHQRNVATACAQNVTTRRT